MPNINKNIIMQAGAAVANATNKAAGLSASTPEPGTIISAIQLVNGGRTIGPAALAHFAESVRNKLLSLLVTMEPIQDFNGYGHPWPAGGGKNLLGYSHPAGYSTVIEGVTWTINADGTVTANGTASAASRFYPFDVSKFQNDAYVGQTLTASGCPDVSGCGFHNYYLDGSAIWNTNNGQYGLTKTFTVVSGAWAEPYCSVGSGATVNNVVFKPQLELGSSATSFAPYANICPISGRTGLDVYAGPTSAIGDATTYSMDWTTPAVTVYAGSADIVSGDIKAAPYYASYNGETLVGPWVSSMDEYDPEGTPTTGAQVVDLGGTMTDYHITGQDIITLVGDNYIWSDSGDVTITE